MSRVFIELGSISEISSADEFSADVLQCERLVMRLAKKDPMLTMMLVLAQFPKDVIGFTFLEKEQVLGCQ